MNSSPVHSVAIRNEESAIGTLKAIVSAEAVR